MKIKKVVSILLAACVVCALAVSAFAYADNKSDPSCEVSATGVDEGFVTRANKYEWRDDTMYNGKASNNFNFELTDNYRHAKVFIVNNSKDPVKINFYKGSITSDAIEGSPFTLQPGGQNTYNVHANGNYDMYWCGVSTSNGNLLEGKITIRVGTTMEEMS